MDSDNTEKFKIVMLGLDEAGGTTILYQLGMLRVGRVTGRVGSTSFYHESGRVGSADFEIVTGRAGSRVSQKFSTGRTGQAKNCDGSGGSRKNMSRVRRVKESCEKLLFFL